MSPQGLCCVEVMHPVAQGLPVHAAQSCRLFAADTLKHQRYRRQTPRLIAVLAPCCQPLSAPLGIIFIADHSHMANIAATRAAETVNAP